MYNINTVILMGNVGKDPIFSGGDKKPFASLSIATNKQYKQNGESKTRTDWHSLVFYGPIVEVVKQFVHSGSLIAVEGELETHSWEDREGMTHKITQIVVKKLNLLDKKREVSSVEDMACA